MTETVLTCTVDEEICQTARKEKAIITGGMSGGHALTKRHKEAPIFLKDRMREEEQKTSLLGNSETDEPISKKRMIGNATVMLFVAFGLVHAFGFWTGLQIVLLNIIAGYFYADIRIAFSHFLMDIYDEHSSGYKHHVEVAKTGFHEGNVADEKDAKGRCAPGMPGCRPCQPCSPCAPKSKNGFDRYFLDEVIHDAVIGTIVPAFRIGLFMLSPWLPVPGFGILFLMLDMMSDLSGAGLPDHWSHNRDEAPYLAKLAQDWRLMMSESDHHKHHADPKIGYAYFSPLTNISLDKIRFWDMTKWILREIYGMEPLNIPAMAIH